MIVNFRRIVCLVFWSAASGGIFAQYQTEESHSTSISPKAKIPGGSPFKYCNESRDTDLYTIEQIELYPQPLYIDDVFEVHLYGTFAKNITNDATFNFLAHYGNNTEDERDTFNFCFPVESIDQPDLHRKQECPPAKGFALIIASGWIMLSEFAPGDYYFKFDALTGEGERIYCLDTEIHFDYKDKKDQHHLSHLSPSYTGKPGNEVSQQERLLEAFGR